MVWLIAGIVVFFGIHLVPSWPSLRQKLIQGIGEWPYKGVFSVLALGGLVLIIKGMAEAQYLAVWQPPALARIAPVVFTAPALILLAAANFANNIKRLVCHPMSWGVLAWAVGHLLANGELASLVLFGSFAAFAVFNIWSGTRRQRAAEAVETVAPAQSSRAKLSIRRDLLAGVIGVAAYILLAVFHGALFGVPAFR